MSHFSYLDGSIVAVYLLATMIVGVMVRKFVGKVEDFVVAGRQMDLYLGIASLAATEFGIVTCMYAAQNGYDKGFAGSTPGILYALAFLLVGVTGFCAKPLREAGVMTVPELFEKRFGLKVRWMSGVVIVLGGLLNMGVFLRTGGEFLVLTCGLKAVHLEIVMTMLLVGVAVYTVLGGMLSVLVTDYLQFIIMSIGLIAVTVLVLVQVGWTNMTAAVAEHHGAGGFNPLVHPQMGLSYIVFNGLCNLAAVLTWQTIVQRLLAAKDAKTGLKVYRATSFFFVCRFLLPGIWGIAALAALSPAVVGNNSLHAMPIFLSTHVPIGLMGILVAGMLAADMSTDSAYMLTWASVIYNDIMSPFRNRRWMRNRGLSINRLIVAAIGAFLLVYGLWYPLKGDLWTYLGVTATIYLSSMATLLIACCYWKRANSWGAASAIAVGAVIPIAFLVCQQIHFTEHLAKQIGPYNSGIATYLLAGVAMIIGSLLKPRKKVRGDGV